MSWSAISWTSDGLFSKGTPWPNFGEIRNEFVLLCKNIFLKLSSAKRAFCLDPIVLNQHITITHNFCSKISRLVGGKHGCAYSFLARELIRQWMVFCPPADCWKNCHTNHFSVNKKTALYFLNLFNITYLRAVGTLCPFSNLKYQQLRRKRNHIYIYTYIFIYKQYCFWVSINNMFISQPAFRLALIVDWI